MSGSDLFGNPVRPGKGERGRPAFEATVEDRNKVKLLVALGWNVERIANAIECSPATLKRHFRAELKIRGAARDMLDAERFAIAWRQAQGGNVGALKLFGQMVERNDLMGAEATLRARQAAARMGRGDPAEEGQGEGEGEEAPARRLGKKEAAELAARESAGGEWGTDLDPPAGLFGGH